LALPFLMGGISFPVFLATIFCLPNLLLFSLTVSLLASVLTEDDGAAMVLAYGLMTAICCVPWALSLLSGSGPGFRWAILSRGVGGWLVVRQFAGISVGSFWLNAGITLGWSAVCLALAAFRLARIAKEEPEAGLDPNSWRARWHELAHGGRRWRQ